MATNPDFNDILSVFSAEGVRFLLMGGHRGLDLWVEPDPTNAERVFRALAARV